MRSRGTQTSLTDSRHGNLNFRRAIYFRFRSGFFPVAFLCGIAAELRPLRVCDLKTMVGSTRLASLERVTTGVGSVSRAARWETDSHGRLLRPVRYLTMYFYQKDVTRLKIYVQNYEKPLLYLSANSTSETWEIGQTSKTTPSPNYCHDRHVTSIQFRSTKIQPKFNPNSIP